MTGYQKDLRERILEDCRRYNSERETDLAVQKASFEIVREIDINLLRGHYRNLIALLTRVEVYNKNFQDSETLKIEQILRRDEEHANKVFDILFYYLVYFLNPDRQA